MPESPMDLVVKRRNDRMKTGRAICSACGATSNTGGAAKADLTYRILRSGMHVGNAALSTEDHLCQFCVKSGKVKEWGPV